MDHTAQLPEKTLLAVLHATQVVNNIPTPRSIANNDSTLEQEPVSYRMYILAWVNLTYVCKRWRKLALGDPSLWTKVPVVLGTRWLREFISRSQDLPILIDYDMPIQSPKVTEELKTIVPFHYHRMRNFHAWLQSDSPYYPLLSSPWPVLEDLHVWLTTVIPKYNLLANEASPLRNLSFRISCAGGGFHRCDSFPWEAPFLRTLSTLDLLFPEGIDAATMERFLDALVNVPGLRHLRLNNESSSPSSTSSCPMCIPRPRRIDLPLETLAFGISTYPIIEHILQHIVAPASARIVLGPVRRELTKASSGSWMEPVVSSLGFSATETVEDRNIGALHRTSARLAATWKSLLPAPPPFISLQLPVNNGLNTVNIHACRTPTYPQTRADQLQKYEWFDRIDGVHPDVTINTFFGEPWPALCGALRELADEHVRMLWLVYQDIDEVPSSSTISTAFPNISVLRLSYPFESPYLQMLTGGPDDTGAITVFPALKVLDFEQCYIRDIIGPSVDIVAETSLAAVLSARREAGIPIVVYLRLAEEIADLRNGRQHSCSEYPDAAAVEQAVDALIATPEVRIIRKEEAVPYAVYL